MSTPPPPKIVPSARTAARMQAEEEEERKLAEPAPPPPPETVPPPRRWRNAVTIEFPGAPWCTCTKTMIGWFCARDKAQANGQSCPSGFNCQADRR